MELLQSWGMNSVRLGVMWPGVSPNRTSGINSTYLGIMRGIADRLEAHNVSSLVEFHQDLLSAKFCGEGAPCYVLQLAEGEHALPWPFGSPFADVDNQTGIPTAAECQSLNWNVY